VVAWLCTLAGQQELGVWFATCLGLASPVNLHPFAMTIISIMEPALAKEPAGPYLFFKVLESFFESLPLCMLQVHALLEACDLTPTTAAQVASLAVSTFSMAYGVFL